MIAQAQTLDALEAFAIILSVVSLIISVVGFFASLKFYRDGVQLQQAANDALTKISEKTAFIQTQVGGMFDKTLDAAIGKREILSDQFEELNEQLEKTKAEIIKESIGQIGAAGEQERRRLASIVDDQIALIREKVETTRESAEGMVYSWPQFTGEAGVDHALVHAAPDGLTAGEISQRAGLSMATVIKRLNDLADRGAITKAADEYFICPPGRRG